MRFKRAILFAGLLAALLLAILMVSQREPRYQGRSLTSWLQQRSDASLNETQKIVDAEEAIRAMPVEKVLPRLLRLLEARDSTITAWVREQGDRHDWPLLQWRSAVEKQLMGIAGFEVLRTNAAPATGKLTELLDDQEHAFDAVRCLDCVGKTAEPALCKGLTNQDVRVRALSIDALASVMDSDVKYIDRIKVGLADPSDFVRSAAVGAVGVQTQAPELAVPLLIAALNDPSDKVNVDAAELLAGFGTNALPAFEALKKVVETGGANGARAAMTTLAAIAPERAVPILTNAVGRGGVIAEGALATLVSVAPETALPILLNQAQGRDPLLRHYAVMLLCKYPVKTPQIQSAIEHAATDSDRSIAFAAKTFLTEQYRQEHPHEYPFAGEPSYAGKTLGQWLETHDRDNQYTVEVTNAVRAMGTNAIPALFKRLVYQQPPCNLPAYQTNLNAVGGFIMLGSNAIPAIPRLEELMDTSGENIAVLAMAATTGTGSNAMPVLLKGLTNRFEGVREEAMNSLTQFGAQYPEQRRAATPIIVDLLRDTNEDVRQAASNALKIIDPQAVAGAGIK